MGEESTYQPGLPTSSQPGRRPLRTSRGARPRPVRIEHQGPTLPRLVLRPSLDCVVGFQRVPDLATALRQARAQGLRVQYIQMGPDSKPMHAVVVWRRKPVILTDAFDGTEIH